MEQKPAQIEFAGVIYEVNITIAAAQHAQLVSWLEVHMKEMLQLPGFSHAKLLDQSPNTELQPSDKTEATSTVHYYLDSQKSLDNYLAKDASRMRQKGLDRFGESITATRRILNQKTEVQAENKQEKQDSPSFEHVGVDHCMNCHAILSGGYCHQCGQKKQRKVVSIFSVIGEFFGELFNWDSRFWRTMLPLLVKPGYLTKTFLEGKRQRYIPPVRMYLITSIIFFLIISFQSRLALMQIDADAPLMQNNGQIDINLGETDLVVIDTSADDETSDTSAIDDQSNLDDDSQTSTPADDADQSPEEAATEAINELQRTLNAEISGLKDLEGTELIIGSEESTSDDSSDEDGDTEFSIANPEENCKGILDPTQATFMHEVLRERAYKACLSMNTRRGLIDFALELLENLPITLLILLPLMALVHKFVYIFSRRYFVEHLLFYMHSYSFLFVFATMMTGFVYLFQRFEVDADLAIFLALLYVVYYFIRSMRVVYGQSRTVTFIKWLAINFVFLLLSILVLTFISLVTAALMV